MALAVDVGYDARRTMNDKYQMLDSAGHWATSWGMNGQLYEMVIMYKTSITLFAQAKTCAM